MIEIGLAGAMGAGKTTVADLLVARHGYTRLSFADPIRYMTRALIGRDIDKKRDRSTMQRVGRGARSPEWAGVDTPDETARRERAQALAHFIFPEATDGQVKDLYRVLYDEEYAYNWGREDYWMGRWEREYQRAPKPVAVDDCRFPVEGELLARHGFFVVKLEVSLPERKRRIIQRDGAWDDAWSNDPTEALVEQIPVHATVRGEGEPEAIAEAVYQAAVSWAADRRSGSVK